MTHELGEGVCVRVLCQIASVCYVVSTTSHFCALCCAHKKMNILRDNIILGFGFRTNIIFTNTMKIHCHISYTIMLVVNY